MYMHNFYSLNLSTPWYQHSRHVPNSPACVWNINPRPDRGVDATPLRFFDDSVKTAACSAAKFGTIYGATFLHMT